MTNGCISLCPCDISLCKCLKFKMYMVVVLHCLVSDIKKYTLCTGIPSCYNVKSKQLCTHYQAANIWFVVKCSHIASSFTATAIL